MNDILFFDGRCPICAHEIKLLRRFNGGNLEFIDIHSVEFNELGIDKTPQELLALLHLKTAANNWVKGLDATVQAWGHTRFGWLFKPLRWPLIKPIADYLYLKWAARRVCKLAYH